MDLFHTSRRKSSFDLTSPRSNDTNSRNHSRLAMWINARWRTLLALGKRSLASRPHGDIAQQMKTLNDKKQFQKVLHLFDSRNTDDNKPLSNMIITQTLKACASLRDLERGTAIHQLVSSRVRDDQYIVTSLIHLYSKWYSCCESITMSTLKCNVVTWSMLDCCLMDPEGKHCSCMER